MVGHKLTIYTTGLVKLFGLGVTQIKRKTWQFLFEP
jgi:hypothetical protein